MPFWVSHVDYKDVVAAIEKAGDKGSVTFDAQSSTNIFDCGGRCSQWTDAITDPHDFSTAIWFDNAASLAPKYALASKYGLAGVGMWEADKVAYDPNSTLPDAAAMCRSSPCSGRGAGGRGVRASDTDRRSSSNTISCIL